MGKKVEKPMVIHVPIPGSWNFDGKPISEYKEYIHSQIHRHNILSQESVPQYNDYHIEYEYDGYSNYMEVTVYGIYIETEEEKLERLEVERKQKEKEHKAKLARKKAAEEAERKTYERLKKKFEK